MTIDPGTRRAELEHFLAAAAGADAVAITAMTLLSGGTVNENWLLDVAIRSGPACAVRRLVLRMAKTSKVAGALSPVEEFAVMRAAYAAGVTLPEPLWAARSDAPLGCEFLVMRYAEGTAAPPAIVHDETLGGPHELLATRLGAELARIQTVNPATTALGYLPEPRGGAATRRIAATRALLDTFDDAHPVIEWGLRWLELNAPPPTEPVLVHGDFRTGNYLVDCSGLVAILDWELAAWGDSCEDMGWFLMRFWRLDRPRLEAGGIAGRDAFLRGYEQSSGRKVDRARLAYWEIMANVRWAAVSVQQARRHLSGADESLELCLTGCRTAEIEFEILRLIEQATH